MLRKTPLHDVHIAMGAKIVDFHGWSLPLHYGSQLDEHKAVRQDCGIFDVSHMTIVDLLGAGGRQFLKHLLANDVDRLTRPGQSMYSLMLNHQGGIVDDLIVYFRAADSYRLVLNSATFDKDMDWLHKQSSGFSLGIQVRDEYAMCAVQGPQAITKTFKALTPSLMDAATTLKPFESIEKEDCFIARTGYTGEDGFEVILRKDKVCDFWQTLVDVGVKPCGLGARDSLRIEAGLMLYGQDINEQTHPYESGLAWTVSFNDASRDFIGKAALERIKNQGNSKMMVGLILEERAMLREQQIVEIDGKAMGHVTSGTFSPILQQSIGFARMDESTSRHCQVQIRDKHVNARIVKPRFVKNGQEIVTEI